MATMMLTNKSSRMFSTSVGDFFPGTSRDIPEKEAIKLLGYSGEIVKTVEALGADAKSLVAKKEAEIKAKDRIIEEKNMEVAKLQAFIKKLEDKMTKTSQTVRAARNKSK